MPKCRTKHLMARYKGGSENPQHESEYFYKKYLSEQDKADNLEGKAVRRVNVELHDAWKRKNKCNWLDTPCLKQQYDELGGDSGEGRCGHCVNCQKCLHGMPPSISRLTLPFLKELGYIEWYQKTDGKDGRRLWDNLLEKSIRL